MTAQARRRSLRSDPKLEQMREAARHLAESTSIRIAAAEIGLNHSTLANLLNGVHPHPRVRGILSEWYQRQHGGAPNPIHHLDRLIGGLPQTARDQVRQRVVDMLAVEYAATEAGIPEWIDEFTIAQHGFAVGEAD